MAHYMGAWGRLMMLTARALHQGHDRDVVEGAAKGRGTQAIAPAIHTICRQRTLFNRAHSAAKLAGVSRADRLAQARGLRKMAEQEWNVHIPIVAGEA